MTRNGLNGSAAAPRNNPDVTHTGSVLSGRITRAGRPRTRPAIRLGLAVPIGLVIAVAVAAGVAAALLASSHPYNPARQPPRPSGTLRAVPTRLVSPM